MEKIQHYLLTHYPTIWNVKLIPMLVILFFAHLLFGLIGYASGKLEFSNYYYYSTPIENNRSLFVCSIYISIFIFIGWLVFYMRNNGLKNLYPAKSIHIYGEWLLILFITILISLIPFSLSMGSVLKVRSIATEEECLSALKTIEKVRILIPCYNYYESYSYDFSDKSQIIQIPDTMSLDYSKLNLDLFSIEYTKNNKIRIIGYKGSSLLYYNELDRCHKYDEEGVPIYNETATDTVKYWLKTAKTDSIRSLMNAFNKLQQKHNLKIYFTPEQWFKRIYNPPFFPVDETSYIRDGEHCHYAFTHYYDYDKDEYYVVNNSDDTIARGDEYSTAKFLTDNYPILQLRELQARYNYILNTHTMSDILRTMLLSFLCVSMWLSIFVLSFRLTDGKSWLITFVVSGILFFLILFLGIGISILVYESGLVSGVLFWIVLFICLFIYVLYKISVTRIKGHSALAVNIFLWLIPCWIPLLYGPISWYNKSHGNYDFDDYSEEVFWCCDLAFVVIIIYPVITLLRKWKGIAEE